MPRWRSLVYSFPVQLVMVHLKRHPVSVLLWLLLVLVVVGLFGSNFGLAYLFLDPEYLGSVSSASFFIMGLGLGVFIVTFQISSYMLNSFRFPFLATLRFPFITYALNNSLVPLAFMVVYMVSVYRFQMQAELMERSIVLFHMGAVLVGCILMVAFLLAYFFSRNTSIGHLVARKRKLGEEVEERILMKKELDWESVQRLSRVWPVAIFLSTRMRFRPVRGVEHYDERLLLAVFRQHHVNAFVFQGLILVLLVILGFLVEVPFFIIPAGASILLMFATIILVLGAFSYWTRGWRVLAAVMVVALFSLLISLGAFRYENRVYGLRYDADRLPYNTRTLMEAANPADIKHDIDTTLLMLDNWLSMQEPHPVDTQKPKAIILMASGGGHRATLWTFTMLQHLDSVFSGQIMEKSMLLSGASGGMIGLAYYRELYFRKQMGEDLDLSNKLYGYLISRDLLNPVTFTVVVNDLFYPWRKFEYAGMRYYKDRAYAFERHFHINTGHVLNRTLSEYRQPEFYGIIPQLIITPTIITDERKLFISPRPVRYLTRPGMDTVSFYKGGVDGVDFSSFFGNHGSANLNMATALRMNATYPYILPSVALPTTPVVEVMDAGIRDNFGIETVSRYVHTFAPWLKEHTNGIILISFNSVNSELIRQPEYSRNLMTKLLNPVGNLYVNWVLMQAYSQHYIVEQLREIMDGKLEFIEFNYTVGARDVRAASMSFRLTTHEKQNIRDAVTAISNRESVERLRRALQ